LGADLYRRVDQPARHRPLQFEIAVEIADVGGLEALRVKGPFRADAVEDLGRVGDRLGMIGQFGRRDGDEIVGLLQIDVDRHAVGLADLAHDVGEVFGRRRRTAPGARRAIHQLQAVGDQPRLEQAVARFLDELGDVDAHRAGEGAASAQGAGVEDQPLPFLQLLDRHPRRQAEQPIERREWPGVAMIGLFEGPELVDRRVLGVSRRDVEVTGVGAHAAAHAGFHVGGGERAELGDEAAHRRRRDEGRRPRGRRRRRRRPARCRGRAPESCRPQP
jgi:hypothetical protein